MMGFCTLCYATPGITFTPTSLNFGNQAVGTKSAVQNITVKNTGTSTLVLGGINISDANGNFSQSNTCGATLNVNATCLISVTFDPQSVGALSATVKVNDNATGSPQSVPVSGTGTGPGVTLSAASLSFNKVQVNKKSSVKTVTLTNSGTASLTVSSVVPSGDFTETNTCTTAAIAAGGSCTISVTFAPTEVWSRGGSIVIYDNAYGSPQQVILLVGMANSGALASVSPTSLSYGDQNLGTTSTSKTVTLTNTGTATLDLNSVLASGDFAQTNDCPSTLATNASCTVNVTFAPSATGSRTGYITFNDTDPAFLQTVTLTGTGTTVSSNISVSPGMATVTPSKTEQFSATIAGVSSTNVTWSVDGIVGGNSTVGTISTAGLYTPPTTSATHIIKAANKANLAQTAVAFVAATNYPGVYTAQNDTLRTGQNLSEVALTSGNVNSAQFGKLFTYPVSGYVFAQPLYAEGVNIPEVGVRNVVYVATEGDIVYAFDADNTNGTGATPLWEVNFTDPPNITTVPASDVESGTNIPVQIGITGTPVIDPKINTLFVVARTKVISGSTTSYVHSLHALNMTTGEEQPGSPVQVSATVSGVGSGSVGGQITFDGLRENPRPALLVEDGTVYIGWASLEDIPPYHGWLIGYNETTLAQEVVLNLTPNGSDGGIWLGGIEADSTGTLYTVTGNGTYDANVGGEDYGEAVLRFSGGGRSLAVADSFSPYNQVLLSGEDWDLGAGGGMLLPDQAGTYPHVMLAAGKGGTVYELNRDALGGFSTTADQNLLTVPFVIGANTIGSGNRAAGPAYWQGQVYYAGSDNYPMQFSLQGSLISSIPIATSSKHFGYPGGSPVVSANGNTNGIVWILQTDKYATSGDAILRAFDAANVTRELYDSSEDSSRDAPNAAVKFTVPTVANGKVYFGTQTALDVFGLLP
jgi:hypothetical protein